MTTEEQVGEFSGEAPGELRIPNYDGNGMWRTLGNITDNGRVDCACTGRRRCRGRLLGCRSLDRSSW